MKIRFLKPDLDLDQEEEDALKQEYGSRYKGYGIVLCHWCLNNHHECQYSACQECIKYWRENGF